MEPTLPQGSYDHVVSKAATERQALRAAMRENGELTQTKTGLELLKLRDQFHEFVKKVEGMQGRNGIKVTFPLISLDVNISGKATQTGTPLLFDYWENGVLGVVAIYAERIS